MALPEHAPVGKQKKTAVKASKDKASKDKASKDKASLKAPAAAKPRPKARSEEPRKRKRQRKDDKPTGKHAPKVVNGLRVDIIKGGAEVAERQHTLDVPFVDILRSKVFPWFMAGVMALQQDNVSFPKHSHAAHEKLADIHRAHPRLVFSYSVEQDDGDEQVLPFEMVSYESAGLWADENWDPCLVVNATFDDGEVNMLLLYPHNLRESVDDIVKECEWCALET